MAAGVGGWLADPAAFAESAKGVTFFDEATNKAYFGTADHPGSLYEIVDFAISIRGDLGKLQIKQKPEELITDSFVNQCYEDSSRPTSPPRRRFRGPSPSS